MIPILRRGGYNAMIKYISGLTGKYWDVGLEHFLPGAWHYMVVESAASLLVPNILESAVSRPAHWVELAAAGGLQ